MLDHRRRGGVMFYSPNGYVSLLGLTDSTVFRFL